MATRNDITGDSIKSKQATNSFRSGYDMIDWSKKGSKETVLQNQHGSHAIDDNKPEVKDGSSD